MKEKVMASREKVEENKDIEFQHQLEEEQSETRKANKGSDRKNQENTTDN